MIRYVDHNGVTWLVPPTAIVAVVLNRQDASNAWEATFNLIDGTQFKLVDRDADQLIDRVRGAEAASTTALGYVKELRDHKLYLGDELRCNEPGCTDEDGDLAELLRTRRVRLRDVVAAIAIHRRECHPAAVTP